MQSRLGGARSAAPVYFAAKAEIHRTQNGKTEK
jgi:hypothetical protein